MCITYLETGKILIKTDEVSFPYIKLSARRPHDTRPHFTRCPNPLHVSITLLPCTAALSQEEVKTVREAVPVAAYSILSRVMLSLCPNTGFYML